MGASSLVDVNPADHMGLVHYYVAALKVPRWVSNDDLVAEGMLGLIAAARGFDPERGYRFSTYAEFFIRGCVLRDLARQYRDAQIRAPGCITSMEEVFPDQSHEAEDNEREELITRILEQLPRGQRRLLRLHLCNKWSYRKLSRMWHRSATTILNLVRSVLLKLRETNAELAEALFD